MPSDEIRDMIEDAAIRHKALVGAIKLSLRSLTGVDFHSMRDDKTNRTIIYADLDKVMEQLQAFGDERENG